MKIFISCLFLCFFSHIYAADSHPVLDDFLTDLESYSADLNQELVDAEGKILEQAKGKVYLRYPGKFHWQYSDPYAQQLITDGETLWVYDEDLEQVTIKDIEHELKNTPAAILSGDDQLYQHFNTETVSENSSETIVALSPKDPESQFHTIHLAIHQKLLKKMIMFDKLGQVTHIQFNNLQRNPDIDISLFEFDPPAEVDVIDSRESTTQP